MNTAKINHSNKSLIISVTLILVILVTSVGILLLQSSKSTDLSDEKMGIAYIYKDSVLIETIDLSSVTEDYSFTIESDDGGYNVISVRCKESSSSDNIEKVDIEIGITEASCPDHICIDTGYIHDGSIPIVCLPNKLVIEVKSSISDTELDGVAR